MGDISAITEVALTNATPYSAPQPDVATKQERALTRSIAAAVQTVNDAHLAGEGREVTFSFDHTTRLPVVKVLDTSTKEVVQQWPPEYLLRLAEEASKTTRTICCLR
jgi:uncharacterized FlaG/YvyC family protein